MIIQKLVKEKEKGISVTEENAKLGELIPVVSTYYVTYSKFVFSDFWRTFIQICLPDQFIQLIFGWNVATSRLSSYQLVKFCKSACLGECSKIINPDINSLLGVPLSSIWHRLVDVDFQNCWI